MLGVFAGVLVLLVSSFAWLWLAPAVGSLRRLCPLFACVFASVCFWFALGLCVVLGVVPAVQQVDKRTQTATSQPIVILSAKTCKNPARSFWRGVCRLKNAKS